MTQLIHQIKDAGVGALRMVQTLAAGHAQPDGGGRIDVVGSTVREQVHDQPLGGEPHLAFPVSFQQIFSSSLVWVIPALCVAGVRERSA